MGRFTFGQIISAHVSDANRRGKIRPAVVISNDDDNDAGEPLFVIAITGQIENPWPDYHIRMPYDRHGPDGWPAPDKRTGLKKLCVAKCNWVREVDQNRVQGSVGYVPVLIFKTIIQGFDKIDNDPAFAKWVGGGPRSNP